MKHSKWIIIFFLILICGFVSSFRKTETYTGDLESNIIKVVKAFDNKDSFVINQMIHKDYGLIVLYRRGVYIEFEKTDKVDFSNPIPEYLPYFKFQVDSIIKYQSLPTFDCDSDKWSKIGLYCDSTKQDKLLSTVAINLKLNGVNNIDQKTIDKFKEIEKVSHRIVLIDKNGGELIFYLAMD